MKKLLLLLLCVPLIGLGQVYIPDANFKAYLVGNTAINTNGDSEIQVSEAAAFSGLIECYNMSINDLTGIEDFTALWGLVCSNNQLTTLDVSNNTALTWLICGENQLTNLNVSQNTLLTDLECQSNQLISLDITQNTALSYLDCNDNQLTTLDVSNNTDIYFLLCGGNQLTSLDLVNNTVLIHLQCQSNQLTILDLSNNPALTDLQCQDNQITSLDVSNNTDLTSLECNNNQLSNLIFNNDIEYVDCSGNLLTCIDVNSTTNLTNLNCSNNMLEQLSIKNNNWLILDVNAVSNNLTCVEVDNLGYATNNWDIDGFASFSLNCNYVNPCSNTSTAIQEYTTNKELLKVTDILGREVNEKRNTPLFYIYNDGTVEKKIIIE